MEFLKDYPDEKNLHQESESVDLTPLKVNAHFHTPYSFSAFRDIPQIIEMANNENVDVLGINDFYTTNGYLDFYEQTTNAQLFPLFNIEFMALFGDFKEQNIRVNDPNNPGRTYFCGKGLDFPVSLSKEQANIMNSVITESINQVREMTDKLNKHLAEIQAPFSCPYEEIKSQLAKEIVRERHIAKYLRLKIDEYFTDTKSKSSFLEKLYKGKQTGVNTDDFVQLENELRSNLLKSGGVAFVEENPKAFLPLDRVIDIILNAGGIPCYPVLLDNKNGLFTDFEGDYQKMYDELTSRNIWCIELIPGRNDFNILKEFVAFFHQKDFIILFGTEHNTPKLEPLTVSCRGNKLLDSELMEISYQGACVVAAHQYLRSKNKNGYMNSQGEARHNEIQYFRQLGNAVIKKHVKR